MTKDEWIDRATKELERVGGEWAPGVAKEYAESLHENYVDGDGAGYDNDPEGAVAEDMTYWD